MFGRGQSIETEALVMRRTPYADADWVVSLFTNKLGKVAAIATRARQSKRRFAGGFEAFHTMTVQLRPTKSDEWLHVTDGSITRARYGLVSHLLAMETAGRALDWLRSTIPARIVEPRAWSLVQDWMDAIDANPPKDRLCADARLAEYGLQLLGILGWPLELSRCVRCDKPCPPHASAYVNPTAGGVVCRACGGSGTLTSPLLRHDLERATRPGTGQISAQNGVDALSIVERTLESHAGVS